MQFKTLKIYTLFNMRTCIKTLLYTVYRASGCKIFMYENVDKTVYMIQYIKDAPGSIGGHVDITSISSTAWHISVGGEGGRGVEGEEAVGKIQLLNQRILYLYCIYWAFLHTRAKSWQTLIFSFGERGRVLYCTILYVSVVEYVFTHVILQATYFFNLVLLIILCCGVLNL
jgi:hypothetical protein